MPGTFLDNPVGCRRRLAKPLRVNGLGYRLFSGVVKTSPVKNIWRAPEESHLTREALTKAITGGVGLIAMLLKSGGEN
jgi:hypothetical protein